MALARSMNQLAVAFFVCAALPTASIYIRRPATLEQHWRHWWRHSRARAARQERHLYEKHWWPLDPPPGHHLAYPPPIWELRAVQVYEPNYTDYWRSLPRYSAASPRLEAAQQAPYFKAPWQKAEGSFPAQNVVGFVVHHKTGENLHTNIKRTLARHIRFHDTFEPLPAVCPREGEKVIHLVRNPVEMIISGYRYHQNRWGSEIWGWGHGNMQDPQCFECDDEDHAAMFETCAFNCTYFELLNRVDELTGSRIEALSARISITSMANFLTTCMHMPNVLHISFDLIGTDYDQSAACILRFLGLNAEGPLAGRLAKAMQIVRDPEHVTAGSFDDNLTKQQLRKHPFWGPDFAKVDALMLEAFSYQAQMYGCPERELRHP